MIITIIIDIWFMGRSKKYIKCPLIYLYLQSYAILF